MRPLARWAPLPLLATPFATWALGLGEIELHSALNQPLDAEIELVSATAEELSGLRVTLAPAETFDRYGLDRPAFLSVLEFRVALNAAGQNVIRVSSTQSIAEPFVTLLVDAEWPRGHLMREYTVFLDPPVLLPEPARPQPIAPAQTRPTEPQPAGGAISRPAAPPPAPAPLRPQAPVAPAPASGGPQSSTNDGGTYGPVQNAETLWGIATQFRPAGVTMNQMMVAVYQANPEAFAGNMNHLRRGAILRIPPDANIGSVAVANANSEVQRQNDSWQGGSTQSDARLVLVPPSEQAAGAGNQNAGAVSELTEQVTSLEEELATSRRLLELRNQELSDLQQQLSAAAAPTEPTAIDPAVADPLAPVADPGVDLDPSQTDPAQSDPVFVDDTPVETPVAAVDPVETSVTAPTALPPVATQQAEPTLLERITGWLNPTVLLIGGGIAALLIAALLFLRRRNDDVDDVTGQWEALQAEVDEDDADHAATSRIREQAEADQAVEDDFIVVETPQTEDTEFAADATGVLPQFDPGTAEIEALTDPSAAPAEQTLSSQTVINLDQADPIAEADFHMAYGLYDQAADLVTKALEADPNSRALKLKLLEVFFVWGNKDAFLPAAQGLREEMGATPDGDWDKVIIMGKQICPDEQLFADATAAAGEVDLDLDAGESPSLDLSFDAEDSDSVDLDLGNVPDSAIALEATGEYTATNSEQEMLDIGERTSAGLEAALFETEDMASATSPGLDLAAMVDDSLAETQESPTVETARGSAGDSEDWDGITMESPTVEAAGFEAPTVESPSLDATNEQPTLETTADFGGPSGSDLTAELNLDDLGLDVSDIDELASDLGDLPSASDGESDTREQPRLDVDDDLLSATGVTQVLRGDDEDLEGLNTSVLGDDEATLLAPSVEADATGVKTHVLSSAPAQRESADGALDLDLDELTQALHAGDTVDEPVNFDSSFFDGGPTPVEFDVGADVQGENDPTATEEVSPLDAQTMTEVGTKLDLARAYIDMGDPDGAKSILEEVLTEGDPTQRGEAQSLIEALPA